ncbi:MAG: hypothetical protein ACKVHE_03445 [Planctomycetales bacterium]
MNSNRTEIPDVARRPDQAPRRSGIDTTGFTADLAGTARSLFQPSYGLQNVLFAILILAVGFCAAQDVHAQSPSDSKLPQRKSFVPVADLDVVLTGDHEGVLLSRDEFQKLYAKAQTNEAAALRLPAAVVVSDAEYAAEISGDHLLIKSKIRFRQFQSGWTTLALPFGQLSVEKASVNGEPAKLGRTTLAPQGKGKPASVLTLFHNKVGEVTLELELSTLLHASGNDRSAAFQLIPIPSGTLNVNVPAGRHLIVGTHSLDRSSPITEPASYSVPIGGVTNLRLFFNDHQGEQRADSLAFASTGYGLNVSPGEVTWQAKTNLQVFGTTYNQIFCTIPNSLEITDVESTGLESWELTDNPDSADSTLITLNYRQAFDGGRDIIFRGVMATETGKPWAVPNLTLRNVTSHVGRVVIQNPAAVRIRLADSDGTRAATGTAGQQTFDVWREDFNLAFETKTRDRELHATVTALLDLAPTGVTFSAATQVESHFAPLFDVTFRLPEDWRVELIEVDGGSLPWQVSAGDDGWNSYRIALTEPLPPGKELSFRFMSTQEIEDWPVESNTAEFTLPTIEIPEASLVEGTFVIRAGDDLELKTADVFNLDPAPSTNERLRFFFQQPDYEGLLTVARKPSRVSAQSLTFTRLDREVLQSHLQTTLDISGGGLRTLTIGLSESAGENLQFRLSGANARIVEQLPGDVENGLRQWTLNLDQRVTGRVVLAVDATTKRNDSNEYDAHLITVPDAERMSGYVAVEGSPNQQLEVLTNSAAGVALQTVDPIDVPSPSFYSPRERIVGAYRFNVPGHSVAVAETRFERVAVPTAVCYWSKLRSVIGRTGELQHRAEFQFVAVGAQGLRVRLPESAGDSSAQPELWSTSIDGKPIEVRSTNGVYVVPIPDGSEPGQQHKLVLFYRTFGPTLAEVGRIKQVPPQVSIIHGEGTEQRLETLEQFWTLHYPNGTMLTSSTGDFSPTSTLDSVSVLGNLREQFTQIDRSSLVRNSSIAAALLILVGAIALSLRRLGVGLLGCAGSAIAGFVMLAWLSTTFVADSRVARLDSYFANEAGSATTAAARGFNDQQDDADCKGIQLGGGYGFNADADESDCKIIEYVDVCGKNDPSTGSEEGGDATATRPRRSAAVKRSAPTPAEVAESQTSLPDAALTAAPDAGRVLIERSSDPANAPAGAERKSVPILNRIPNVGRLQKPIPQAAVEGEAPVARDKKESSFLRQLDDVEQGARSRVDRFSEDIAANAQPDAAKNHWALQNAIPQEQAGQVPQAGANGLGRRYSTRGRSMSGLLSLSMALQVPEDSQSVEFQYAGNRTAEAGIGIDVAWQDRDALDLGRGFLMTAVALFFWLMISLSVRARAILAVLGVSVPLGLISVAPVGVHTILDGIFLGSVVAIALWIVRAVFNCLASGCLHRRFMPDVDARKGAATVLMLAALAGGSTMAEAAEPAPPVPPPGPSINSVIIPYEAGSDSNSAQRVLLSREQFIQLWNLANPDQKVDGPAPVKGLVDAAFYDCQLAKIDDQNASVQVAATLILHSFQDGQVALPLPLGTVALSESLLDGKPASLVTRADKSGQHVDVIVSGKGRHTLDLKFAVPAQVNGSVGQFTLPLRAVPAGRVVFRLPAEGLDVRVNGSTNAYRRATDTAGPTIEIPVENGSPLTVAWRPPEQQGMVASIVHVDSSTAILIDDVGISESSRVSIKVPQGAVSDLSFDLPAELRVRQIAGPHLAGWELNEDNGNRQLRVFFNPPVTSETSLELQLFLDEKQGDAERTVDLPVVAPREVTRDTGLVAVLAAETFQVRSGQVSGLSQIAANQKLPLPAIDNASRPSVRLAWRFASRPFGLQVIVGRRQQESVATIQHAIQVSRRKIHLASLLRASLKGAPRPGLTFELPEELLLLSVNATSMSDWYVSESDATNPRTLTIEFEEPLLGNIEVVLEAQITKFPYDLFVEVAPPFPLEIGKPTSYAGVWFDDAYAASLGDTYGWNPVDPGRVPVELHKRVAKPLQYAFRSTAEQAEVIGFEVGRAKSRLVADAVVMTSVADAFLDYSLALNWQISDAAVDQFTFTTPLWLKDRLTFTDGSIREVTSDVAGETVRWTLHLQDAVKNRYFVLATATMPPATKKIETPAIGFLDPKFDEYGDPEGFTPMETQRQYVLLINQSQSQLSSRHESSNEPVSASDIPINVGQSLLDQAAELLRIRGAAKLPSWSVRRLVQQAGAPASVNVADLTLSIAADGTWRGQAVYTVRNRRRQFLGVRLPNDSRLLSLFVKGQPSRPVITQLDDQPIHLIPLPKASDSDVSFQVKLVYSGHFESRLPSGVTFRTSELDMPAPKVVTPNESAEFGIPVARTLWQIHLPKGVDYSVMDASDRTNVAQANDVKNVEAYVNSKLQDASEMLTIVSGKGYTRKSKVVASNNLKQIGRDLHNHRDDLGSDEESSELQRKIAETEQKLAENYEQIELYVNTPNDIELYAYSQTDGYFDTSGVLDFDEQGDVSQRQQVLTNNFALIVGNGTGSVAPPPSMTASPGPMVNGPGPGVIPKFNTAVPDRGERTVTKDSKLFRGYKLSTKGGKQQSATRSKTSSGKQVDRFSAGTRVMRRQQSLSNIDGLNSFVDFNNGNAPEDQNSNGVLPNSGGAMFGSGGGGGMGGGQTDGLPQMPRSNASEREIAELRQIRDQERIAQIEIIDESKRRLRGQIFEGAGLIETQGWTKVGGLSLPIDIPVGEQSLSFSRVGGEAKLALQIRSRELVDTGVGLVWTLVWLGIGATLIVTFSRVSTARELFHPAAWIIFVGGLLSFLILPGTLSGLGFAGFLMGLLALASRFVRAGRTA